MALNISMPGAPGQSFSKGFDEGSNFMDRILKNAMAREQMKAQQKRFDEEMALRRAAAGRNAALFKYRLQELQDKHAAAEFERNMMNQLMGGGGQMPPNPQPMNVPQPQELAGEGMGMFSPEGLQQIQQQAPAQVPQQNIGQGGVNLELLKQNPMLRGYFKHKFGFDPLAPNPQTPEEKAQTEINKKRIEEENKASSKRIGEIEKEAKELTGESRDVATIQDLLVNQGLKTGAWRTIFANMGMGSEKLGQFNAPAVRLQAALARLLSQRGGEGAAKLAAAGKPSSWNATKQNLGITKSMESDIVAKYKDLQTEYKKLTGKDLPYNLATFVHEAANTVANESDPYRKMSNEELNRIIRGE